MSRTDDLLVAFRADALRRDEEVELVEALATAAVRVGGPEVEALRADAARMRSLDALVAGPVMVDRLRAVFQMEKFESVGLVAVARLIFAAQRSERAVRAGYNEYVAAQERNGNRTTLPDDFAEGIDANQRAAVEWPGELSTGPDPYTKTEKHWYEAAKAAEADRDREKARADKAEASLLVLIQQREFQCERADLADAVHNGRLEQARADKAEHKLRTLERVDAGAGHPQNDLRIDAAKWREAVAGVAGVEGYARLWARHTVGQPGGPTDHDITTFTRAVLAAFRARALSEEAIALSARSKTPTVERLGTVVLALDYACSGLEAAKVEPHLTPDRADEEGRRTEPLPPFVPVSTMGLMPPLWPIGNASADMSRRTEALCNVVLDLARRVNAAGLR